MANGLPPGIAGYVAGQQNDQRQQQGQLQALGILSQLQAQQESQAQAREMRPLQLAELKAKVAQAEQMRQLRGGILASLQGGGGTNANAPAALSQGAALGDVGPTVTNEARMNAMPAPAAGAGAGAGGIPPQVRLQLLSGDPGMVADAKAWIEHNKPIVAREGAPVIGRDGNIMFYAPKIDPGMSPQFEGGRVTGVSNIPGYVQAVAERTTAVEGAKAGFDIVELPDGKGGKISLPRSVAIQALRGGSPAPAPAAMPPSPVPGAPRLSDIPYVPPAQQRVTAANMDAGLTPTGTGPAIPSSAVLGYTPPAAQTAGAAATATGRSKVGVEFEEDVLKAGRAARSNLTSLQVLAPNLEKLPTGPLYPMMVSGGALFKQFGIDVGELGKQVGPAQATNAVLNQLALKLRNPAGGEGMPGALSDKDREFLVKAIPSLGSVPAGNKQLFGILMALEQRKIDEAGIVNAMQKDGKSSNEIRDALQQYADSRSITQSLPR